MVYLILSLKFIDDENMKKVLIVFFLCCVCCAMTQSACGATSVNKEVNKRARQFKKEGWKVFADAQSLESQIETAFVMESEVCEDGEPKYISVTVVVDGGNMETARMKARELAKMKFASALGESIQSVISMKIGNTQTTQNDTQSFTELVTTAKSRALHKLGRIMPVIECWREGPDKSMEVLMTIMYDVSQIGVLVDDVIENTYE